MRIIKAPAARGEFTATMENIHRTLRQRILSEEYYPGQKLSENALAKEFGCSRTPVREAFTRLEHEHLIETKPQSGTYVRMITTKEYVELLEVRSYIEGLAFRLAIEHARDAEIDALVPLLTRMDMLLQAGPATMQQYAELHYNFHFTLIKISHNDVVLSMFERLNLRASHMFLRAMNAESAARTQEEHYRILRMLKARDPKGEKFMIDHLWRKKLYISNQ